MAYSRELIIYMIAASLLAVAAALFGWGWIVLLIVWLLAEGMHLFYELHDFETGLQILPDVETFRRYSAETHAAQAQKELRKIADMIATLEDQYSASVIDKNTRIDALQSQINPHFLYNTLECIRSEAISQHNDSIAQMSKTLSSFFRYCISQKENIVTVQAELDNIRNYCFIQNYRFENKFELKIIQESVDDNNLDCFLPKMTLQPIVENCIFHGLETKPGKGTVSIQLSSTDRRVVIIVSDDGVGMSEEQLQTLRKNIKQRTLSTGTGNGIALNNVNQKIELLFGQEYGLQVYSTPGAGTDVEIQLPIIRDRRYFDKSASTEQSI